MSEQLTLAGFDAPPAPTDRLFFAVYPDADTAERIAALAQQLRQDKGLKGRPLDARRFHVTLHHLGDHVGLPQEVVAAASKAAASLDLPAFELQFDRAVSFLGRPRNRPFVLRGDAGLKAVAALQRELGMALKEAGLRQWVEARFTPHVTLLYDDRCLPELPIEPIHWTARELVLTHSLLGKTRHLPLGRWALRD
jgi:2'-5' RNA ligase